MAHYETFLAVATGRETSRQRMPLEAAITPATEEEGLEKNQIAWDVSVSALAEMGMRKFGENPKRAGTVSGRFRLNAL